MFFVSEQSGALCYFESTIDREWSVADGRARVSQNRAVQSSHTLRVGEDSWTSLAGPTLLGRSVLCSPPVLMHASPWASRHEFS